eukprot:4235056-Alexandrium_andersonii.AAC.1
MVGPSRPVSAHQRATTSDRRGRINALHAATSRANRHARVRSSRTACQITPIPSKRERTTKAPP